MSWMRKITNNVESKLTKEKASFAWTIKNFGIHRIREFEYSSPTIYDPDSRTQWSLKLSSTLLYSGFPTNLYLQMETTCEQSCNVSFTCGYVDTWGEIREKTGDCVFRRAGDSSEVLKIDQNNLQGIENLTIYCKIDIVYCK